MRAIGRSALALLAAIALSYIAWDQIEARALRRAVEAIAVRGEPTTVGEIAEGADTPERHDAARIYAAALQRVRAMPPELTFRLGSLDVDNLADPALDVATLQHMYRPDAPALQLLDQATPLDFNGFGEVEAETESGTVATLNSLAAFRADLSSVTNHGDAAAEALIAPARLWRTTSSFLRMSISTRLLASVRILLRHAQPSDASLATLQRALMQLPDRDDTVREVMRRRAAFLAAIARPADSVGAAILKRLLRPAIDRSNRLNLATFEDALAAARQPWPQKLLAAHDLQARFNAAFESGRRRRVTDAFWPRHGVGWVAVSINPAGIDLAARRVTVTVLAIER